MKTSTDSGFTEDKHFRGAAAVHAVAAELLLLGFNVARPDIDKSTGDDLLCICRNSKKVTRVQVRSRHVFLTRSRQGTKSETVKLPQSLLTSEGTSEVVCIALRLPELGCWFLGLFGRSTIGQLALKGKGSAIARAKYASEGSIDFRIRVDLESSGSVSRAYLSDTDVTAAFDVSRSAWVNLLSRH